MVKNRRNFMRMAVITACSFFAPQIFAKEKQKIIDVRVWPSKEYTRLTIESTKKINFEKKLLEIKNQFNITLLDIQIDKKYGELTGLIKGSEYIKNIVINKGNSFTEINYIFSNKVEVSVFSMEPIDKYSHRLVIDIKNKNVMIAKNKQQKKKDFIVVLDAGHGGEDPGAIGENGTYEKDVTLAIVKKLKKKIDETKGFKAILTRDGDYFLPLYERIEIAHKQKANIFISIHADSANAKEAMGSSVYILSERGASSASSKWLEEKENLSDLIGGSKISKKESSLKKMLMDMLLSSNIKYSKKLAENILSNLKHEVELHKYDVESAGFAVLKSPNIPSILIETAFISNPNEEKKLKTPKYQDKIVSAILDGIQTYKEKIKV